MDIALDLSAREIARQLGTSAPRVLRTARDLGLTAGPQGARSAFTSAQAGQLREALGVDARVPGLTVSQVRALAALIRAPRGLPSVRAVALRAGLSPTTAGRATAELRACGLVIAQQTTLPGRRAHKASLLRANWRASGFAELADSLARVRPAAPRRPAGRDRRVPDRLQYLFWNTAASQMTVEISGPYIARRLITTGDFDGLAWGSTHLRADDWESAARARGLDPATRSLALNLAQAATA